MPSLPLSRRARGTALAVAALAAAILAPAAQAHARGGTLFVQTDDVAGNTVVVYDRGADGKLRDAGAYPTGGRGGKLDGAVVDNLASQGSLAYDRERGLLYAVNAGSDTLTVFGGRGGRLRRRQVLTSGGRFPVSVTLHDHRLYVLNARDGGSIQGYLATRLGLIRIPGWHRALGLDPAATPEFTHTPGQVAFTPDGRRLLVTTKANTDAIDVFRFDRAGAPVLAADNRRPGTVPFAVDFDAGGHLSSRRPDRTR
jgi:DNA-binding beta-propeller fold protein YncE